MVGMTSKEAMLSAPGLIFDLFELYLKRKGWYKNEIED